VRLAKMNFAAADAHRGNGKRFIVHADEKVAALLELELAIRVAKLSAQAGSRLKLRT